MQSSSLVYVPSLCDIRLTPYIPAKSASPHPPGRYTLTASVKKYIIIKNSKSEDHIW